MKYIRAIRLNDIILIVTILIGLYQYNINNKRLKQESTINYIVGFHNLLQKTTPELLDTLNIFGYKGVNYSLSVDTLDSLLKNNQSYRQEIDHILTYLNRFAIGCCYDHYFDENVAWATDCQIIVNTTYALVPYFQILERERNFKDQQYVCPFLRSMVNRWLLDRSISRDYNESLNKINIDNTRIVTNKLFPASFN